MNSTKPELSDDVVKTIKNLLNAVDNSPFRDQKIKIVSELFDYLTQHKDFVHKHKQFACVVKKKFHEFAYCEDLRFEDQYFMLFDEFLPTKGDLVF